MTLFVRNINHPIGTEYFNGVLSVARRHFHNTAKHFTLYHRPPSTFTLIQGPLATTCLCSFCRGCFWPCHTVAVNTLLPRSLGSQHPKPYTTSCLSPYDTSVCTTCVLGVNATRCLQENERRALLAAHKTRLAEAEANGRAMSSAIRVSTSTRQLQNKTNRTERQTS